MRPYLSSLSLSMQNSVSISSKNTSFDYTEEEDGSVIKYPLDLYEKEWRAYTPNRKFYYPSLVTPVSANITASGTIFQWPMQKQTSTKSPSYIISLNKPDELKTEKQLEEERLRAEEAAEKDENVKTEEKQPKPSLSL